MINIMLRQIRGADRVTYNDQACEEHVRDVMRGAVENGEAQGNGEGRTGVQESMHACTQTLFIGDQTYNIPHAKTRYFYMTRQALRQYWQNDGIEPLIARKNCMSGRRSSETRNSMVWDGKSFAEVKYQPTGRKYPIPLSRALGHSHHSSPSSTRKIFLLGLPIPGIIRSFDAHLIEIVNDVDECIKLGRKSVPSPHLNDGSYWRN